RRMWDEIRITSMQNATGSHKGRKRQRTKEPPRRIKSQVFIICSSTVEVSIMRKQLANTYAANGTKFFCSAKDEYAPIIRAATLNGTLSSSSSTDSWSVRSQKETFLKRDKGKTRPVSEV